MLYLCVEVIIPLLPFIRKIMPDVSIRAGAIPASPIRKLSAVAEAAAQRGVKVYHLNIGQPDIASPKAGLDALHHVDRTVLEYSPSNGFSSLRKAWAEYYSSFGVTLNADDFIVTAGASEAALFALLCCLDPGDEIIAPEPLYANYTSFAIASGVRLVPVSAYMEDGFRLPSAEQLAALVGPRTRGILICNPNNPTGYVYSSEELQAIGALAREHNLFLFVDEVYREFVYGDTPFLSALTLEGAENNVVVFDSFSKRFSECGIRIGAVVTRNTSLRSAIMRLCQARLSPPLLGQIVAEASLAAPESYGAQVYAEYKERRDCLMKRLAGMAGVTSSVPMGAFYTMARLPVDDAERFCAWCLSDFAYEGKTVMLAPGAGFYLTPGMGHDEVRIAYVLKKEDLMTALTVLEEALKAYPGRLTR